MKLQQCWIPVALLLIAALLAAPARADFLLAQKLYEEKKIAESYAAFLSMAELGYGPAQFKLASMALKGEGEPKDKGRAVGWLMAAADNGYRGPVSPEVLLAAQAELTPQQRVTAQAVVSQYGKEALKASILPAEGDYMCASPPASEVFDYLEDSPTTIKPRVTQLARPIFPSRSLAAGLDGVVIASVVIGRDGIPYDPEVLADMPEGKFDDAVATALLKSRFEPSRLNGQPVASRAMLHYFFFQDENRVAWDLASLKRIKAAAEAGNRDGMYFLGLVGMLDPSVGVSKEETIRMLVASAQAGKAEALYWVARRLSCSPAKRDRWMRQAAAERHVVARLILAISHIRAQSTEKQLAESRTTLEELAIADNQLVSKYAIAFLASSSEARVRNPQVALAAVKRFTRTRMKADPHAWEATAAAYANNGKFKEAVSDQRTAIDLATDLGWNTAAMAERLTRYETQQPWYGDLFRLPLLTGPRPEYRGKTSSFCDAKTPECEKDPRRKPLLKPLNSSSPEPAPTP